MAITRAQQQNQMKGNRDKTPEKYPDAKESVVKVHPLTNKPTFPTMSAYIDASKEPRHAKRGVREQRQSKTFGKNG